MEIKIGIIYFNQFNVVIFEEDDKGNIYRYTKWNPKYKNFNKHSRLMHYFYDFPDKFGGLMLDYVTYYKNYDYLEFMLGTGIYDSLLDNLISYASYMKYNEIVVMLIQYSNTLSRQIFEL